MNYVILPLFSERKKEVPEKSGLNQWNARGRTRDPNEVYIPVPILIYHKFPNFFPPREIQFSLCLPNGSSIQAKICQDNGKALEELRERSNVKWTYISPAGDFQADGEQSGKYILGGEELTLNSRGESIISYADYAIVLVDEIEKGNHICQRISVVRA